MDMIEEEFVNTGATINQIDKICKFFNILIRLFNIIGNLIYEYNLIIMRRDE